LDQTIIEELQRALAFLFRRIDLRSCDAPRVAVSFLGTLLLAAASLGQNPLPSGNLYGTVLDEEGATVLGVTARLSGPGAPQTAATDAKGDFHFLNLSPGGYSLALEHAGFAPVRRDFTILLGKNEVLTVTMPVAATTEVITVSGEAPLVDSRKTETGANFGQGELQTIPTTRDPWAILRQVPGVLLPNMNVGGDQSGAQSSFVGKGSHPDQNIYNLDGVAVTQTVGGTPVYFDFDSLDSIEVATGGSEPTLASPGVTLNLVTKRGTNRLLGSARVLYTGGTGWDYGVEAGGPIWKDRLWLWGAGARNTVVGQTFVLGTGEPLQQKPALDHWNAKLNAQVTPSNSATLSYLNSNKLVQGVGAGSDRTVASTSDVKFPTSAYRVEDSQVLSAKLFAAISFSYLSSEFTRTPQGGIDKQADLDADAVWQNSYQFYRSRRPQHQIGLTASRFFDSGDLRHELKFGFGYKHTLVDSLTSWPGDQLVGDETAPLAVITRLANPRYEVNYTDAYAGDTIQAGNLTVNVGARFDYQQAKNLPSAVPANPVFPELLPAVHYGGDSGYPIAWRQFEPRVGATYSLGSNRKTLLRASYSRFANQLRDGIFLANAFPGPAYLAYGWNDANGNHRVEPGEIDTSGELLFSQNIDPSNPGHPVSVNRIAKNFRPPTTDELIVGFDGEILSDLAATLAYTHRASHNPVRFPLIGTSRSSYQYLGNATGTVVDSTSGSVVSFSEPYYGLTTNPPPFGIEIQNRPDYNETYNGVELQLVKRLSHGWMLRASFAYNDWQKRVGARAVIDPNNSAGGSNASGPVVEPVGSGSGTVYINSKWQFNVSGMVQLPFGVEAAANLFGRQGFPKPYWVLVFTHDTADNRPQIQIGSVAAHRLSDVVELDLHVEKPFRVGSALTIIPLLDCFNVADSRTVLQRVGRVGSYDSEKGPPFAAFKKFNQPAELLGSRTFRGGVRISF
jgi:Carboxypeptidase regulatory-like domain